MFLRCHHGALYVIKPTIVILKRFAFALKSILMMLSHLEAFLFIQESTGDM